MNSPSGGFSYKLSCGDCAGACKRLPAFRFRTEEEIVALSHERKDIDADEPKRSPLWTHYLSSLWRQDAMRMRDLLTEREGNQRAIPRRRRVHGL